jgi:hypothetical protein
MQLRSGRTLSVPDSPPRGRSAQRCGDPSIERERSRDRRPRQTPVAAVDDSSSSPRSVLFRAEGVPIKVESGGTTVVLPPRTKPLHVMLGLPRELNHRAIVMSTLAYMSRTKAYNYIAGCLVLSARAGSPTLFASMAYEYMRNNHRWRIAESSDVAKLLSAAPHCAERATRADAFASIYSEVAHHRPDVAGTILAAVCNADKYTDDIGSIIRRVVGHMDNAKAKATLRWLMLHATKPQWTAYFDNPDFTHDTLASVVAAVRPFVPDDARRRGEDMPLHVAASLYAWALRA